MPRCAAGKSADFNLHQQSEAGHFLENCCHTPRAKVAEYDAGPWIWKNGTADSLSIAIQVKFRLVFPMSLPNDPSVPPAGVLRGLDLDSLFAGSIGWRSPVGTGTAWEPPPAEELALLFPGYEITGLLGRGGMGAVYRARQLELDRIVAVKLLPAEMSEDATFVDRFRGEARMLARLQHPHIVNVFESGATAAGHLFFVMEYVDGEDLARVLQRGPLAAVEALRTLKEVCDALEYAHSQGVIHRDIKPSNILLTQDGYVKVVDFGLARIEDAPPDCKLTSSGVAMGTFEYSSPEQSSGRGGIDHRSDLYSLGVVAYELLTGEVPRGIFDPPSKKCAIDPIYDDVILRALAREPERRYSSATAFREALERPQKIQRRVRRLTRVALGVSALGLLAAGLGIFAWHKSHQAQALEAQATLARLEAEGLVNFMLTDLRDKLERSGRLDALEGVVAKAESWFVKVPAGSRGDDFEDRRAEFFRTKSAVLRVQREYPQAVVALQEALGIRQHLASSHPGKASFQMALALAHQDMGEIAMWQAQFEMALTQFKSAKVIADGAAQSAPADLEIANGAALVAVNVARALGYLRRFPETTATFAEAQRQFGLLAAAYPDDQRIQGQIRQMEAELGSVCEAEGKLEEALAHFQRLGRMSAVASTDPAHDDALAGAAIRSATVLTKLGRGQEALSEIAHSLPLAEQHTAERPGNREDLQQLEWNYRIDAEALTLLGRTSEAAAMKEKHRRVQIQISSPPGMLPELETPGSGSTSEGRKE